MKNILIKQLIKIPTVFLQSQQESENDGMIDKTILKNIRLPILGSRGKHV